MVLRSLLCTNNTLCEGFLSARTQLQFNARVSVFTHARFVSSSPHIDPTTAIIGIVCASCCLLACIGVMIAGLRWKVLFGRVIWPVALAGTAIAAILRLVSWSTVRFLILLILLFLFF
jgi:mannose/fructose/N-acetylgalactosamine-specific phosphotransferase system component IID